MINVNWDTCKKVDSAIYETTQPLANNHEFDPVVKCMIVVIVVVSKLLYDQQRSNKSTTPFPSVNYFPVYTP